MALHIGEWLVLAMMVAMIVYSLWEADKGKMAVQAGHKSKVKLYKETMVFLWLPSSVLLLLIGMQIVPADTMGLAWHNSWRNWVGVLIVVLAFAYAFWSIQSISPGTEQFKQLSDAMSQHQWMMPADKRELRWFAGGLSMSAGFCEELLFRGFFLLVFSDYLGAILSLILGSFLFGLCHLYQGWQNVLRTGIVGLILGGIYVFTESLWVVIALHALMDIYGGILGYIVHKHARFDVTTHRSL
ncbi:CPBP family intramembrane metalloprotease [Alteromonas sediminis]|uniref:CPBP family intramembrane metalloprotease n=1 Tax=Alteromonas sediminis TaxID=2259342 RepID=A0A3N5YMD6_9ALTE|nr:CPBP family intramembrane glutamic endopeptidase [Alteromonas sediminis]RPJ66511.1 CPBP family intramembrane metalloprotease [Alteromonas sediminis]